jgi:hypothetical protein
MSKLFHTFFDSYRVRDHAPTTIHIGRNHIGSIEFYPSDTNPFMEDYGYVRVYDNGELFCDEHLAKLLTYTDSHKQFMEYCFEIWKNKTNKKIFPKMIILSRGDESKMDEMRPYLDSSLETHLVP